MFERKSTVTCLKPIDLSLIRVVMISHTKLWPHDAVDLLHYGVSVVQLLILVLLLLILIQIVYRIPKAS